MIARSIPDPYPVRPFTHQANGSVDLPGSKSLTNRALLLASLSGRPIRLTNALFSEDTEIMAESLQRLGCAVSADFGNRTIVVEGNRDGPSAATAELHVGNAGTAARFLTALCAAAPRGTFRLDGVPQMRRRPMQGLIDALRRLGAVIECEEAEGHFPMVIRAAGLAGGEVEIDASESSQMLSALLMTAPLARAPVTIRLAKEVRWPFVRMTTRMMVRFGQPEPSLRDGILTINPGVPYNPGDRVDFEIEADASAASYFAALPAVTGGMVHLPDLGNPANPLQGDTAFLKILESIGLKIERTANGMISRRPDGARTGGIAADFRLFSDTFLTLAAISPLLSGPTVITGIGHTRYQETDRIAGMATELRRIGQHVIESADSLEIHPQPIEPAEITTYEDHRFAMSFAILGCANPTGDGRPWLSIRNPGCCAKTFPDFFQTLEGLHRQSTPE